MRLGPEGLLVVFLALGELAADRLRAFRLTQAALVPALFLFRAEVFPNFAPPLVHRFAGVLEVVVFVGSVLCVEALRESIVASLEGVVGLCLIDARLEVLSAGLFARIRRARIRRFRGCLRRG